MGHTYSDGAKVAIAMIVCCAIISMVVSVTAMTLHFHETAQNKLNVSNIVDHTADFTAMAVYGKPIPVPNVVAALDVYGPPETLCVQMEDLKGKMGGTPYPMSKDSTSTEMAELISVLRKYYSKEVYVYVATPNGGLQLCISELPHSSNPDGENQNWSD